MINELDAKWYKPTPMFLLVETSGELRQEIGDAFSDLRAAYPELQEIRHFNTLSLRQLAYYYTDADGLSTTHVAPRMKKSKAKPEYNVVDFLQKTRPDVDPVALSEEEWDMELAKIMRLQHRIIELYEEGDPSAMRAMLHVARYTGYYHAVLANSSGYNPLNPEWVPSMEVRNPFDIARWNGKLYIPERPVLGKFESLTINSIWEKDVVPMLRGPDEILTYLGGRMSTLPVAEFARRTGVYANIVAATQIEKWAGIQAYETMGRPANAAMCGTEEEVTEALSGGCSTLVIANVSDAGNEVDVEAAIFKAAHMLTPYGEHPPQIIIKEIRPVEHPRSDEIRGDYVSKCLKALSDCGFAMKRKVVNPRTGSFQLVYELVDASIARTAAYEYAGRQILNPIQIRQPEDRMALLQPQKREKVSVDRR